MIFSRVVFYFGLLVLPCSVLISCGGPAEYTISANHPEEMGLVCSPLNESGRALEAKVLEQINVERVKHGRKRLLRHVGLEEIAREHCREMAANAEKRNQLVIISHSGFDGRKFDARVKYHMGSFGENLAGSWGYGDQLVRKTVADWMKSPGHRKNALADWQVTGVGVYQAQNGAVYISQLFGNRMEISTDDQGGQGKSRQRLHDPSFHRMEL